MTNMFTLRFISLSHSAKRVIILKRHGKTVLPLAHELSSSHVLEEEEERPRAGEGAPLKLCVLVLPSFTRTHAKSQQGPIFHC